MGLLFESLSNFENENEKLKYLLEQAQASSKFFGGEYTRLRAENKKLREALEYLNTITVLPEKVKPVIREALKEVGEE